MANGTIPPAGLLEMLQGLNLGQGNQQGVPYGYAPGTSLDTEDDGINLAGVGATLKGLTGLASAWAGLQGVKQGREQLRFTKDLANRNLSNQAQTVNTNLADRQARRLDASGGGQYQSVADYMKKNQVSGGAI